MTRALGAALIFACLAGCATRGSIDVPKEVKVRVVASCVDPDKVPKRPENISTEDQLMLMPEYQRTIAAWVSYRLLFDYARLLEAIAIGCSKIPKT